MPFLGCVLVLGRFVFDTHCVRDRTGSSRAFGFNTNWRDAGHTYGVNGAVTSVDARNVESGNKVDDQPKP
jgi:hypothetical protein